MSVNETKFYTRIDKEECVFTWVIDNWPVSTDERNARISSPILNVGSNEEFQFQLKCYDNYNAYDQLDISSGLELVCLKNNTELPCKFEISIIMDDQTIDTYTDYWTFIPPKNSYQIFEFLSGEWKKYISSMGTLTFRCEFSLFTSYNQRIH
ncbi:hypothetical protein TKK_0004602 [Trichogramma kaykai]|uniref:Uncharacterized protein n=1 Tax=Trichogramma kaykai TaxID=54128 RepID=A0ABD2XMS6_9HYME